MRATVLAVALTAACASLWALAAPASAEGGFTLHAGLGLDRTTGHGASGEAGTEALEVGAGYVFGRWFELELDGHVARTRLDTGAALDEAAGWRWLGRLRPGVRWGAEGEPTLVLGPVLAASLESVTARAGGATTETSARTVSVGVGGGLRLPLTGGFSLGPELVYAHALSRRECIRASGRERCPVDETDVALFTGSAMLRYAF